MKAPRFLAAWLPAFRLERCGFAADELAVVVSLQRAAMRVVALTPTARAEGLYVGMSATEARALVPGLVVEVEEPEGEGRDRLALQRTLMRFADQVDALEDDLFALHVGHTAALFGGEAGLCRAVRETLAEFGHACRLAVADDPRAASALAAYSRERGLVAEGEEAGLVDVVSPAGLAASLLAPLPLRALRPAEPLLLALRAVGVELVGELALLDAASVAGRYGEPGRLLHRVARGLPVAREQLAGETPPPETARVRVALGGATSTLQLHFVLPGLLAELCAELAERERALTRLVVRLVPERGVPRCLSLRVGRATRDPVLLAKLVRQRVERVQLDGPVDLLELEVVDEAPEPRWQPSLAERSEAGEDLHEVVARLVDALGEAAVTVPVLEDAWRPELAWRAVPVLGEGAVPGLLEARLSAPVPLAPGAGRPPPRGRSRRPDEDPVLLQRAWERVLPLPRPTRLSVKAAPASVRCDAVGRPVAMLVAEGSRGASLQAFTRVEGPERLSGEWWTERPFDRSLWVVEVQGRVAWLCEEGGSWTLAGWFD